MKTTSQLVEQDNRIYNLIAFNAHRKIKQAHPETDGNFLLAHNWGNEEAKKYQQEYADRLHKVYLMFRTEYKKAFVKEYPEHIESKRYTSK